MNQAGKPGSINYPDDLETSCFLTLSPQSEQRTGTRCSFLAAYGIDTQEHQNVFRQFHRIFRDEKIFVKMS
jgi:hypothetical protein